MLKMLALGAALSACNGQRHSNEFVIASHKT